MRTVNGVASVLLAAWMAAPQAVRAESFTGPAEWRTVQTNAVRAWQKAQEERASATFTVEPGVAADSAKREVRLLAEAVGHRPGITAEFLLVGPLSDRAYESAAVTVASPSAIVRAVERLGLPRGGGVGSRPFRFWPCGERVAVTVRDLSQPGAAERPLQALVRDAAADRPLLGDGGLVFTGGKWSAAGSCLTDSNMPAAVISLYNEPGTVFDVPCQAGQSEVYGRVTLAAELPYGRLLEVVVRPLMPADGQPRVQPLTVTASVDGGEVVLSCAGAGGAVLQKAKLSEALVWLRARAAEGRELFVTLEMDDAMPLARAADVARVFGMLDGSGVKLDGKTAAGLYPRAFLPQEKWRERKDRNPQPFELHLSPGPSGALAKKLVFIEEDWSVEGLDPKLTPREYPFEAWAELPGLVEKAGGADNKVALLFVFAPAGQPLGAFMPGVRALSDRLPLVYVFPE
jgi:hypothetical protein